MARLHAPLCDRLGTRLPIIQAPMAGGPSIPQLVAAAKAGNPDFVAMWAGQAIALSRALPAAELVAALEAETLRVLDRLAALRG